MGETSKDERVFFMKYQTTNKAINKGYLKVCRLGYCTVQNLLTFQNPIAYTAGVYGWNSDIYDFGTVAISTGYRPTGENVNYEIVEKYEKEAEKINMDYSKKYDERKTAINHLLAAFIAEISK